MVNLVSSSGKLFLLCVCWKHRCGIGFSCCHLHADENYCAWRMFCAMGEVITSYICIVVSWWLSFASPSVLSICLYHWICVRGFYLCNDSLKRSSGTTSHEVCDMVLRWCPVWYLRASFNCAWCCCEACVLQTFQESAIAIWLPSMAQNLQHFLSIFLFLARALSFIVTITYLGTCGCQRFTRLFVHIWPNYVVECTSCM